MSLLDLLKKQEKKINKIRFLLIQYFLNKFVELNLIANFITGTTELLHNIF